MARFAYALASVAFTLVFAMAHAEIIINEIMVNPSAVFDVNGEWFELYNSGDVPVDINGWTIEDIDVGNSHTITSPPSLLVPARGYLVLGRKEDSSINGGVDVDYMYSGFFIANDDDEIVLKDTSGTEIDRVVYDASSFPIVDGASIALKDPSMDNNVASNWCTSTASFGNGDLGTPGAPNDCMMEGGGGGDPHFHTLHGEHFSYHGVCDLVLLQNSLFGDGLGLHLHVRTEARKGYSSISNVALKIGDDVLEVTKSGTHYLNGVGNVSLPAFLEKKFRITLVEVYHGSTEEEKVKKFYFTVELEGAGEKIEIKKFKDFLWVNVVGSASSLKDCEGLMGQWQSPGKFARDGVTTIDDEDAFGQEWQVLESEPKLFRTLQAPQHPQQCLPPRTDVVSARRQLGLSKVAAKACKNVQGPKKEFCVFDVVMTGDVGMANVYLD